MASKRNDAKATEKILALYMLLLFTGRKYTLIQLAEHFDCSKQTILRLIQSIESRGDIVETGLDGRRRWYRLKTPRDRPHASLSTRDVQQLVMCRDMLLHLIPKPMLERLNNVLGAATSLLDEYRKREEALAPVYEAEMKGRVDYEPFAGILEEVGSAIRERRLCRVVYQALGKDQPREHVYAPLALVGFKDSFYVKGRKVADTPPHDEIGPMALAVQRIHSLVLLSVRHNFEAPKPDGEESFGLCKGEPFQVQARFDRFASTYVSERIWSTDQVIETMENGEILLRFTATSPEEVIAWVLSFGERAELLSPADLRTEVARQVEEMRARYRNVV